MNIKQAKTQITRAMKAYFTKNEYGSYVLPLHKQRPIFLMGAPGIGKTAIMEQIAQELDLGLVSYTMTHHTRQSALGLPFIVKKDYDGESYDVSEYTMSEIIASVYDMMAATGKKEGILFLDEINCVSETLAPAMLQFLQYKTFGRHAVPEGWIVVTAGNPPEYNSSVREFDIVTWDRLKRIDVEPDYDTWKEYAYQTGVHAAITTYLDIKKGSFYSIENTVDGMSFVTARGWSDLSDMIGLYERHDMPVDLDLVSQYIQSKAIARDFAIYYDLYNKYKADYQIDTILGGNASSDLMARARAARYDERLSLLGLITDAVGEKIKASVETENLMREHLALLKNLRTAIQSGSTVQTELIRNIENIKTKIDKQKRSHSLSQESEKQANRHIALLTTEQHLVQGIEDKKEAFAAIKTHYDQQVAQMKTQIQESSDTLDNTLTFIRKTYESSQELIILTTQYTQNPYIVTHQTRHPSTHYTQTLANLTNLANHTNLSTLSTPTTPQTIL